MGIYDRDYEREQNYGYSPGFRFGGGMRSLSTNLVIAMAIVYVVQLLTKVSDRDPGWFTDTFSLWANLPRQPWMAFQLITYGFLHSPNDITHILFNCFGLWMFGRIVETRYGQREYLTFFLAAVAFAGLAWVVSELVANQRMLQNASLLGASGGIAAVLILFCLNYPRQQVFIWGVLPIPAWVFAIMFVGYDLFHASKGSSASAEGDNVAYTAHIGGVIFALVYYKASWQLSNWVPSQMKMPKLRRRPPLRVHDPADDVDDTEDAVDVILRKIREHGQDSLTSQERRILEEASREYQKRRS
jgi:membrane associated rhomboid family serine protease